MREVQHRRWTLRDWKRLLPGEICREIGFEAANNAEAVKAVIAFSQSRVCFEVWERRKKLNRALRASRRGAIPSDQFYASLSWKKVRYQALTKSSGKCQCCGATGDKAPLHVDHIKPRSKYPELALVLDNLQVLCADCNVGKLNQDETDWRNPTLLRVVK